jgi:alpha-L-fucosidase 2
MLMQSHSGTVRLFPAIPASWRQVSFDKLRAVGAFLVSAQLNDGKVTYIRVESEKGGLLRIAKPADGHYTETNGKTLHDENGVWNIEMEAGEIITLKME